MAGTGCSSQQTAWSSLQLGRYILVVAYNMHWEAHEFALPALKKQMKWYQVAGTEEMPDEAECLKEQKMIEVKARTIILLQGR